MNTRNTRKCLYSFNGRNVHMHFYSHKSHVCRTVLSLRYQPISWKITFDHCANRLMFEYSSPKSSRCSRRIYSFFLREHIACVLRLQDTEHWLSESTFCFVQQQKITVCSIDLCLCSMPYFFCFLRLRSSLSLSPDFCHCFWWILQSTNVIERFIFDVNERLM